MYLKYCCILGSFSIQYAIVIHVKSPSSRSPVDGIYLYRLCPLEIMIFSLETHGPRDSEKKPW